MDGKLIIFLMVIMLCLLPSQNGYSYRHETFTAWY